MAPRKRTVTIPAATTQQIPAHNLMPMRSRGRKRRLAMGRRQAGASMQTASYGTELQNITDDLRSLKWNPTSPNAAVQLGIVLRNYQSLSVTA